MGKISDVIDSRLDELGIKGSKMCDDLGISRSTLTELRKGRAVTLKADRATAVANYLGISVEELLGVETEKAPTQKGERSVSDDDIKAAFFEGAEDLSKEEMDEMWDDARDYIQYKMAQRRRKKDG